MQMFINVSTSQFTSFILHNLVGRCSQHLSLLNRFFFQLFNSYNREQHVQAETLSVHCESPIARQHR
jgi:hypothetical protein